MPRKNIPKTLIALLSIIGMLACTILAPGLGLWQWTEQTQTVIIWLAIFVVTLLVPALVSRAVARKRCVRNPPPQETRHPGWLLYTKVANEAELRRAGRWGLLYGFLGGVILDLVLFLLLIWAVGHSMQNLIM